MELTSFTYQKTPHTAPKGVYLLLHGYGSNGQDLISLAPELAVAIPDFIFISPNAIENWEGGFDNSYQWYSLNDRSDASIATNSIKPQLILSNYVEALLQKYSLSYNDLIVSGFSQGGMLSLHATNWLKEKPLAIISHSGFLSQMAINPPLHQTNILLTHGLEDTVVLPTASQNAHQYFCDHGISNCQIHLSNGLAHGIDHACISATTEFLGKLQRSTAN